MYLLLKRLVGNFWKNLNNSLIQYQFYIIYIRSSLLIYVGVTVWINLNVPNIFYWACSHINCTNSAKAITLQLRWAKNQRGNNAILTSYQKMADTSIHVLQITLKQSYQELPLKNSPKTQDTPVASLHNIMQAIRKLRKNFLSYWYVNFWDF